MVNLTDWFFVEIHEWVPMATAIKKSKSRSKSPLKSGKPCGSSSGKSKHPCHAAEIKRLNRISGQVDGIKKMIDDRRYCPDILIQIKAACSAMKSLETAILETHLKHCVKRAMESRDDADMDKKIGELMKIFRSTTR